MFWHSSASLSLRGMIFPPNEPFSCRRAFVRLRPLIFCPCSFCLHSYYYNPSASSFPSRSLAEKTFPGRDSFLPDPSLFLAFRIQSEPKSRSMDGGGSGLYAVGGRRSCAFVVSAVPTAKSPWSSFFLGMVIVIACRVGGSLSGGGKYPLGGRASVRFVAAEIGNPI